MAGPWTYKTKRHGSHGGEQIALRFGADDMFTSRWYPPWQNGQMQANARCMVDDLNAAFEARKIAEGEVCEHGICDGEYCQDCNQEMKRARKENGLEEEENTGEEAPGVPSVQRSGEEAHTGSKGRSGSAD